MTYTLVGEISLIDKEIEDIINKEENTIVTKYDLEEVSILRVLEDINTISLFGEKKIIICSSFDKLDNEDVLIKYLNNQSSNILIIKLLEKLDERKKITKELKKNTKYIEVNNIDLTSYIKKELEDYKISNMNISLLKEYCNNDFNRLKNEIEKLKLYKLEDKEILKEDILKLVKKGLDKNIFDLQNAINKKQLDKIFDIYYELLNNNYDEIRIISILANNFKLIYKVKNLIKNNNDDTCLSILKIHPYRFKILKEQSYNYSSNELLQYIKKLSDLDIKIKSGKIDKMLGLELFLASLK